MFSKTIQFDDGIVRTIEGKQFNDEVRVYRVYGDMSDPDVFYNLAEKVSELFKVTKVTLAI